MNSETEKKMVKLKVNANEALESLEYSGIYITNLPTLTNSEDIKQSFNAFLKQSQTYRDEFITSRKFKGTSFDGYSYNGQPKEECSNQYPTDLLHSFVLSEFSPIEDFPIEFNTLLHGSWKSFILAMKEIEHQICQILDETNEAIHFYDTCLGHMLSANYYPPTYTFDHTARGDLRLSAHTDVSFITIFPFGLETDFSYYHQGFQQWITITEKVSKIVLFSGYLLEQYTYGRFKALQHCVRLPTTSNEDYSRYSFAFFSLPYPQQRFQYGNKTYHKLKKCLKESKYNNNDNISSSSNNNNNNDEYDNNHANSSTQSPNITTNIMFSDDGLLLVPDRENSYIQNDEEEEDEDEVDIQWITTEEYIQSYLQSFQ